jgi:pimeloyl-ACP methyl ester carboxylesterase
MLNRTGLALFGCILAVLAGSACAEQPDGAYLDGGASKVGVILLHGRFGGEGDATSLVVNPLRIAIHQRLGFHTLSLNYPQTRRSRSGSDEAGNFPAAYQRIDAAIAFLTKERGVTRIYLMGHSLGTRITTSYLATHAVPELRGYIGVGIYGGGRCEEDAGNPLNSRCNLKTLLGKVPDLPVLDVVAMATETDVRFADGRSDLVSNTYRQVRMDGADHKFLRKEEDMINTVVDWLKQQQN